MKEKNRGLWVYDIETIASVFTYIAINVDTEEIVKYAIHKDRSDYDELIKHLKSCNGQIGFNNIGFDYPIIHYILTKTSNIDKRVDTINGIYKKSQEIIEEQNKGTFGFEHYKKGLKEKDWLIDQMDLFKLWHFNNMARTQSLKGLEIAMNYPNVMEMPFSHERTDVTLEEIESVFEYNLNDVLATYEFYKLSKGKIDLRIELNSKYSLNCINYPDSKIGEELILKLYCQKTGKDVWDVKKLRTNRDKIVFKDCILNYIQFESKEFNKLLTTLKSKIITETKGSVNESVIYKGFKYDFGTGGIHGCIKPGVYESTDTHVIIDCDVSSLYPSIAVVNNFYPEHLGTSFCNVYSNMLDQRLEAKKAKNMVLSDGFKLSLNSVYGKSNDKFSFLYDPKYTMQTTLNGQLLLTMLSEKLVNTIDMQVLQINTDGITMKLARKDLDIYYDICNKWMKLTQLQLEYVEYSKMIICDVNNYLAFTKEGKVKNKGRFEINKDYHKDNSFKIIPIALERFFKNGISVEDTVNNHINIYDFCGRQKFKGKDYGETHELDLDENQLPYDKITKQQKNTRYYISNNGCTFIKVYNKPKKKEKEIDLKEKYIQSNIEIFNDSISSKSIELNLGNSREVINKGYQVTIFNNYKKLPFSDYNVNLNFYIDEANKEISSILGNQLQLF